ncbi:MAG: hypothetical protein HY348_00700 [Nitrospira defluvii]|nr:hypothetical protein [Nitrospira defluvii]
MATGNGLKDVVVLLTDATKGKPFKFEPLTIEARDCRFLPFVTVVKDGSEVVVMNMDPAMHDIQAYETSQLGPRVLFNTPLPMNPPTINVWSVRKVMSIWRDSRSRKRFT